MAGSLVIDQTHTHKIYETKQSDISTHIFLRTHAQVRTMFSDKMACKRFAEM
jgi:hypothetical protein